MVLRGYFSGMVIGEASPCALWDRHYAPDPTAFSSAYAPFALGQQQTFARPI